MEVASSAFDLPERLHHKLDPAVIGADELHFAALDAAVRHAVADATAQRDAALRRGGHGREVMDRDTEVRRLAQRLRTLERYGRDLCLGRMVPADGSAPVYVGRTGLRDAAGEVLLADWRTPAAEPFFGATLAHPMGLSSRRRYRWRGERVVDFWDESLDGSSAGLALDEESAFIASLGTGRTARMRDVLGTIQADQDAIIRAGSRGTLVVDGGPGTGKTVVALHRAAYLLHADPRVDRRLGGVLVVGPHHPYLSYVADVLPSLGEEGVQLCTPADLVPEGATAVPEPDPAVAGLKADGRWVGAIDRAVRVYEEVPSAPLDVETPWGGVRLRGADWAEAFEAPDPDATHNEARTHIWEALVEILTDRAREELGEEPTPEGLRRAWERSPGLREAFDRAWPLLDPTEVVEDLWSVPAYLRHSAGWLDADDVRLLTRRDPRAWTEADLPLLDAARLRVGDPDRERARRRRAAEVAARREEMSHVIDHLVASDDSEMKVMSMLRVDDLAAVSVADVATQVPPPDALAGPYAHVVVDEAQELTDAQWQMLLARCPSRSFTVVGDRAQARHGFTRSWAERLAAVGLDRVEVAGLSVNYRTPAEVMAVAEPVIRAVLPDVNVPTSIRRSGVEVAYGSPAELDALLAAWAAEHDEGTACVISAAPPVGTGSGARVSYLTPELAKGLEFDLVVLVDPDGFGEGITAAVDTYVAMTRATRQLVVLT